MIEEYHINGPFYYVSIFKHEFLIEANALKIYYRSDIPDEKDLKNYLLDRHPELARKVIKRIYKDKEWKKDENDRHFATIIIFFK